MNNQVDHSDRGREPRDKFHPEYDSFREWLDAEAPDQPTKTHNTPRYAPKRGNAVTVAALVKR